jgi:hypothetical protein
MAQIFHPSMNTISRVSILGGIVIVAGLAAVTALVVRSPYFTGVGVARQQPVPFSHAHHVGDLGFDCRYCHTAVEETAVAGIPPSKTCMNCHSQIWADSPMLEMVRTSFAEGDPIEWVRVHDLPDFAYFDHSVHVAKGVGCVSCHGRVDQMPLMWKVNTLHMGWCLDCHREPETHLRPRDRIFDMAWQSDVDQRVLGAELAGEYDVQALTDCSTCHR